jgi:hypothetical protein
MTIYTQACIAQWKRTVHSLSMPTAKHQHTHFAAHSNIQCGLDWMPSYARVGLSCLSVEIWKLMYTYRIESNENMIESLFFCKVACSQLMEYLYISIHIDIYIYIYIYIYIRIYLISVTDGVTSMKSLDGLFLSRSVSCHARPSIFGSSGL